MSKLSEEQCNELYEEMRNSVENQLELMYMNEAKSVSIQGAYGLVFMSMLDERLSQKTCPYCHEDKEGYIASNGSFYLYYDRIQGWLIHVGKDRIKPRPIKYCPMCGRKLLPIQNVIKESEGNAE